MENPEIITGLPLILLGALGAFIAFSLFAMPDEAAEPRGRAVRQHAGHPEPSQYVIIGLFLGFVTAIEVALYYIEGLNFNFLIFILLVLSAIKFFVVIGFFMHLRFDNKVFAVLFLGGLGLAIAVFTVAIATLEANLV
jgi:cytochrome c oxidase subunit IV